MNTIEIGTHYLLKVRSTTNHLVFGFTVSFVWFGIISWYSDAVSGSVYSACPDNDLIKANQACYMVVIMIFECVP